VYLYLRQNVPKSTQEAAPGSFPQNLPPENLDLIKKPLYKSSESNGKDGELWKVKRQIATKRPGNLHTSFGKRKGVRTDTTFTTG
jgi:hypothetical protein